MVVTFTERLPSGLAVFSIVLLPCAAAEDWGAAAGGAGGPIGVATGIGAGACRAEATGIEAVAPNGGALGSAPRFISGSSLPLTVMLNLADLSSGEMLLFKISRLCPCPYHPRALEGRGAEEDAVDRFMKSRISSAHEAIIPSRFQIFCRGRGQDKAGAVPMAGTGRRYYKNDTRQSQPASQRPNASAAASRQTRAESRAPPALQMRTERRHPALDNK